MELLTRAIEAEARLRPKNQLTMPDPIVRALDAAPDDILIFETDPTEPGVARVRVMPRDFAGSLTGIFGTAEETLEYVRRERTSWGE
jgi:hypothetical protein